MEESFHITMELDTCTLALQVADSGARIVSEIYRYADEVRKADQRIKDVATQVRLVSEATTGLSQLLDDPSVRTLRREEVVTAAEDAMSACLELFGEMLVCLIKFHAPWPFKHMTIEEISARMNHLKGTLELLISVLQFARLSASGAASREESESLMRRMEDLIRGNSRSATRYEEVKLAKMTVSGSPAQSSGENTHSVISHFIPILVEKPNTTRDSLYPISRPEQQLDTGDRRFEVDTMKEGGQAPAHGPRPDDASAFSQSDLDRCIGHIRNLLRLSERLRQSRDGEQIPRVLTAEYIRVRKALDSIILGDEDERTPPARRQSFQMAPVKAYLRRAKYSWKDWFLLSSIIKGKKEPLIVPELHEGKDCPFPDCQAHTTSPKESPQTSSGEKQEMQLFEMPGDIPARTTTPPNKQPHPAAGLLGPTPCPLPNLSLTTINTDGDDTSSCHSCSSQELVSSISPIKEYASRAHSSPYTKDSTRAGTSPQPMPVFSPKVPKSAHDALQLWTTILD